jgi:hypothetical protein
MHTIDNLLDVPDTVVRSVALRFEDKPLEFIRVMEEIKYSPLLGCWYFTYAGMFVGVETDGYMHT